MFESTESVRIQWILVIFMNRMRAPHRSYDCSAQMGNARQKWKIISSSSIFSNYFTRFLYFLISKAIYGRTIPFCVCCYYNCYCYCISCLSTSDWTAPNNATATVAAAAAADDDELFWTVINCTVFNENWCLAIHCSQFADHRST